MQWKKIVSHHGEGKQQKANHFKVLIFKNSKLPRLLGGVIIILILVHIWFLVLEVLNFIMRIMYYVLCCFIPVARRYIFFILTSEKIRMA